MIDLAEAQQEQHPFGVDTKIRAAIAKAQGEGRCYVTDFLLAPEPWRSHVLRTIAGKVLYQTIEIDSGRGPIAMPDVRLLACCPDGTKAGCVRYKSCVLDPAAPLDCYVDAGDDAVLPFAAALDVLQRGGWPMRAVRADTAWSDQPQWQGPVDRQAGVVEAAWLADAARRPNAPHYIQTRHAELLDRITAGGTQHG